MHLEYFQLYKCPPWSHVLTHYLTAARTIMQQYDFYTSCPKVVPFISLPTYCSMSQSMLVAKESGAITQTWCTPEAMGNHELN